MTRKEIKEDAQDELLYGMKIALSNASNDNTISDEVKKEMIKQFERVEKLFGYAKGANNKYV